MLNYLAKRIGYAIFVVWGAVTAIFILLRLVPGDPAEALLGPNASHAEIAAERVRLGLNSSGLEQYWLYLKGVVHFDFGDSFRLGGSAMGQVWLYLPATVELALVATAVAIVIALPLGILAALRPRGIVDRIVNVVTLASQSIPTFVVGIVLILIFARRLQILPSGGDNTEASLIMPAATLALPLLGILTRLVRSGLTDILGEGFIETARARGLSEQRVVGRHALRNVLIPVVTVGGIELGHLLGGAVIVETVYAWPGVGRLLVEAITNRDYTVVEACTLVISTIFVLLNLLVDLLYGVIDPRVRVVPHA